MKVLNSNLAAAVQSAILNVQLGLYNANVIGGLALDPEMPINFKFDVVTANTFNTITRTSTTTPAAAEVTTDVTDSYTETTTETPATTQHDDLSTSGGDDTDENTTYNAYPV